MPAESPWIKAPRKSSVRRFRLRNSHPGKIVDIEYRTNIGIVYAYDNLPAELGERVFLAMVFAENPGVIVNEELKKPWVHFTKVIYDR